MSGPGDPPPRGPGAGDAPHRRLPDIPGRDPDREADDELRFHLDMRAKEYMARGMPEHEARAAAEARLGDPESVRSDTAREVRRERRAGSRRAWVAALGQDLRHALRTLLRTPSFTGVAVTTLAVGVGATTAIFSLVWAVLLAPLPYPEPGELVRVWETSPQGSTRNVVSAGNVHDWQRMARSFEVLGGYYGAGNQTLFGEQGAELVGTATVEPEVLEALGVDPLLGRALSREDAAEERATVVISESWWRTRYGADRGVLGRTVTIGPTSLEIVGVMPESLEYPSRRVDFWVPLYDSNISPDSRTSHNFFVLARLADGVSLEDAQREMDDLSARIAETWPAEMTGWGANVTPLHRDIVGDNASLFRILLGAVVLVMLIACGNLANLVVARSMARHRELAVRGALGAGRGRILRHLLVEGGVIAVGGAVAGAVLAWFLLGGLLSSAPAGIPGLEDARIDLRMLSFTALVSMGSVLLFALLPALRFSRVDLNAALRSSRGASERGHVRLRAALLTAQVALSVVLLIGSGLLIRSFRAVQSTDLGFDATGLAMTTVFPPSDAYPTGPDHLRFFDELVRRVESAPGVEAVTTTSQPPGTDVSMTFSFAIEGRVATNPSGREDDEMLHAIGADYFSVLGRNVVEGRDFAETDTRDATPVVILNETLARKHFPDGGAVGHRMAFRVDETPWREIVGVVADARMAAADEEPAPAIYIPFAQKQWDWLNWSTLVVRARPGVEPASLAPVVRTALGDLNPDIPPRSFQTVDDAYRSSTAPRAFAMTLVTGFGAVAILLSLVGLYGLISYSITRERRDIGVRMALGADARSVVWRVVLRAMGMALGGALVGVVFAALASPALEGWLYGVSRVDLGTYGGIVMLVAAFAFAASVGPAVRAGRIDPAGSLRSE